MTGVADHVEDWVMPDSNWDGADPIDRIDWQQIVELRTGRDPALCAAES